ncbi:S8 family serine peptidase [Mesorhizobium sp. M0571]|uniref:S8 family serine peptidase n=1 Tax=Mesorhizobium sp. M0571 TaxID=2956960 RepID=UPI003338FA85
MAEPKYGTSGHEKKNQASTSDRKSAGGADDTGSQTTGGETMAGERKGRYLIAMRTAPGFLPMSAEGLQAQLTAIEGVDVVRRIRPRGLGTMSASGGASTPEIVVATMDVEKGELLRAQAAADPRYIVEPDAHLIHADVPGQSGLLPQSLPPTGKSLQVDIQIVDEKDQALPKALVQVYGTALPAQGVTGEDGRVQISVFGDAIRAIYVRPAANCWEKMVMRPSLNPSGATVLKLRSLAETFSGFPAKGIVGWGHSTMQLDHINAESTGRGIKVGIIDSGCDNTHPQLTHVENGFDFTEGSSGNSWANDTMSHGTHCAGVIGAASNKVQGVRGFAPEAELYAFKVFPGGRTSDLIDALDQCIDLGIDVVNMSLGTEVPSELVAQKILEARDKGVACIVAAGNSGGPVQFPGILPTVLTVSAVGKLNTYPIDTAHALTVLPGGIGDIFPAKFSCFGPQVRVCGPGVAIVSCVPGGYAAWDGTSMATPHITGLAALVLAHHPAFQGKPKQRNAQRVEQLFQILQASATPCVLDVARGGAGLPNSIASLGQVSAAAATPQAPSTSAGNTPSGQHGTTYMSPEQQQIIWAAMLANPAICQAILQLRAALLTNPAAYQTMLQLRAAGLV